MALEDEATTTGPATHFGLSERGMIRNTMQNRNERRMAAARRRLMGPAAHWGLTERSGPPIKLGVRKQDPANWTYGGAQYINATQYAPSRKLRGPV